MTVLAFDTATPATAVALCRSGEPPLEARDDPAPGRRPGHATRLLPLAVDLLRRAGIGWADLERIAVGTGPGTFTGLRVGIATARALARARGIPLTGVSTLHSLALGGLAAEAASQPFDAILAVLDARRREVFVAGWRPSALERGGEPFLSARALRPEALAEQVVELGLSPVLVGNGAVEFRSVLERSEALIPEGGSPLHQVSAIHHCRLVRALPGGDPADIHPEYLRLPDAEIARRSARP
ncbi:MAG: tRNA (adenosine(37)-N6)-threonylcarbamoyltransferase complex dimerization subunit type 1 TsaB [Solirubrobacterales bacterium]|nr:tRNA (adenosine(37)-N6)-threonylcarbamoyltransferase complex dimerization subunit type 1 TsaB [Solirubrobacterales bacterium]MBV9714888.1 tRNA (adenosine(37)-N6)-threonylcarbamoyltransferase complex dimerization subunit type 1 TsaB [Solirubrobacterales bacterium]